MAQLSNAELSRVTKETPLYRAGKGIVQRLKVLEVIHDKYDGAGIDFSGVLNVIVYSLIRMKHMLTLLTSRSLTN